MCTFIKYFPYMRRTFLVYLILLISSGLPSLTAQENDFLEDIQADLDDWWVQRPVEKLYIHFDKELYIPGETIWFKAYLLEGRTYIPSYLSLLSYVEFWSPTDSLLSRKVLKMENGQGAGSFQIDSEWEGGELRIQAYTQWMRNSASFFQHQLQVLEVEESDTASKPRDLVPDVQFLPESGVFLAGCSNQLGIKAVNSEGNGIRVEGGIRDGNGRQIATFSTPHHGMGRVSLTPEPDATYRAEYVWEGDTLYVDLPTPEIEGIRIQVDPSPFVTRVDIHASVNPTVSLVGVSQGKVCFLLKIQLKYGSNLLEIPNSSFPTGILQLTLLDEENLPLCERMVWIDKKDQLQIDMKLPPYAVAERTKVSIPLQTSIQGGIPSSADLSVSVADQNGWRENDFWRKSLQSYMLWASESREPIEASLGYFHGEALETEKIDEVMLTHFWRKIDWVQLTQPYDASPEYLIERSLRLEGKAVRGKEKPYENASVLLIIDNMFNLYETQTDSEGNFAFDGVDYSDTSLVILQIKNEKDKQRPAQFKLNHAHFVDRPLLSLQELRWLPETENIAYIQQTKSYIENERIFNGEASYELEAVEITGKRSYTEEKYALKRMYVRADRTLDQALFKNKTNVIEVLRSNFPGVNIVGTPGNYSFQPVRANNPLGGNGQRDEILEEIYPSEPTFFIDGIQTELNVIEVFPMEQVDFIDLVFHERAALLGKRGNLGLVSIFTKEGVNFNTPEKDQQKGILRTQLPGYSISRTFYQPKYDLEDTPTKLPDLRNTLLWAPNIQTDSTGQGKVEFFTGDVPGRYKIVVEGMTPEGKLGYGEAWIEVK